MKQHWQRFETKIDALSLRERAMAFAIAALALITLVNTLLLDPLLATEKRLSQQLKQEQQQIAAIQAEIQARVKTGDADPDAQNRERLRNLQQQLAAMDNQLRGMQGGLVSPDKMAALLEDLLKRNGRLHLASLRTLPVVSLSESAGANPKSSGGKAGEAPPQAGHEQASPAVDAVYKHGVEIVLEGSYLDIMQYLAQLETMPWQLFWERAQLNVDAHPKASLTLTLFTLSLEKKWLNI